MKVIKDSKQLFYIQGFDIKTYSVIPIVHFIFKQNYKKMKCLYNEYINAL